MTHKDYFRALDRTLRYIMGFSTDSGLLFGEKVKIFHGDFRQILLVILRGDCSDIVHATINASYLQDYCQVLTLTKNMHLQRSLATTTATKLNQFSQWILDIGDGKIFKPNDGYAEIEIPPEFLISKFDDRITTIIESTYPNLLQHYNNECFQQCRAVLASTIETVDQINQYVLTLMSGFSFNFKT